MRSTLRLLYHLSGTVGLSLFACKITQALLPDVAYLLLVFPICLVIGNVGSWTFPDVFNPAQPTQQD